MRWPDFIIIGAMKCATSTLHEQLAQQHGVVMSTPKEPNFFSDDEAWERGIDWYRGLFNEAEPTDICGESSTHYTKRPTYRRTINRMRGCLPETVRFIYVMRHPIDRLVSHYLHEWTQGNVSCPLDEAVDRYPELIAYSRYAMQLEPYLSAFGMDRVLPVFFDRLSGAPQEELERIARFVKLPGPVRWAEDLGRQNVTEQRLRRSPWRDALLNLPGCRTLRRTLIPSAWRERMKAAWRPPSRPTLAPSLEARLVRLFDDDLAALGSWLGRSLDCASFRAVSGAEALEWEPATRGRVA